MTSEAKSIRSSRLEGAGTLRPRKATCRGPRPPRSWPRGHPSFAVRAFVTTPKHPSGRSGPWAPRSKIPGPDIRIRGGFNPRMPDIDCGEAGLASACFRPSPRFRAGPSCFGPGVAAPKTDGHDRSSPAPARGRRPDRRRISAARGSGTASRRRGGRGRLGQLPIPLRASDRPAKSRKVKPASDFRFEKPALRRPDPRGPPGIRRPRRSRILPDFPGRSRPILPPG